MSLAAALASRKPELKRELIMAHINKSPEDVVAESLKNGAFMGFAMTVLLFFYLDKTDGPLIFLLPFLFLMTLVFYNFNMVKIKAKIIKRQKEIDKDVLFAGRYLLVKLNSGQPLINALIDASKSYGVANNYFKEIVRNIELGKPIEKALQEEAENSPSEKFRKILFQISNALKIGIDVTEYLEATLNEIANQQLIEINRFGKKLNSVTLFYMLFAVVLPSLGLTIFMVVASLASVSVDTTFFAVVLFFLIGIQAIFIVAYKSIRPNINI